MRGVSGAGVGRRMGGRVSSGSKAGGDGSAVLVQPQQATLIQNFEASTAASRAAATAVAAAGGAGAADGGRGANMAVSPYLS